jgi:hypothetical protein
MRKAIKVFATLLNERLVAGTYTTEDSVRYTFFHALLSSGVCGHTDVALELPHPTIRRAKIDTLITTRADAPSVALEFKYDRIIPSGRNLPRTRKAGAVFKDLFRLARVPEPTAKVKYFVYLTDSKMASYFRNPDNGFRDFFELDGGQSFALTPAFVAARTETFQKEIGANQITCTAIGVFSREVSNEHSLRIYEVKI